MKMKPLALLFLFALLSLPSSGFGFGGLFVGKKNKPSTKCIKYSTKPCPMSTERFCTGIPGNIRNWCVTRRQQRTSLICAKKGSFGVCARFGGAKLSSWRCFKPKPKFVRQCKWRCRECVKRVHLRRNVCTKYKIVCKKKARGCSYQPGRTKKCKTWGQSVCLKGKVVCKRKHNKVCAQVAVKCIQAGKVCIKHHPQKNAVICSPTQMGCLSYQAKCVEKAHVYVK